MWMAHRAPFRFKVAMRALFLQVRRVWWRMQQRVEITQRRTMLSLPSMFLLLRCSLLLTMPSALRGEENPAFTLSLISPASTAGVAVSYACLADATSLAGEYEIGASVSNSNFAATVKSGTLTVKAKEPVGPVDPVDPVDPDNPDGPNNPDKPDNPDGPNTPIDPSDPGNPSNPSEPGDADGPSSPEGPSDSNCSGESGGTGASNAGQNAGSESLKNQGACSALGRSSAQEGLGEPGEDGALALSDLSEEAGTKTAEQQNVLLTDKKVQFLIAALLALGCGAVLFVVTAIRRRRNKE